MSEKTYGGYALQEIYDVMERSTHGGEIQWDREKEVAVAALPDLLGGVAELTTLRAENERLRELLADAVEDETEFETEWNKSARAALQAGENDGD